MKPKSALDAVPNRITTLPAMTIKTALHYLRDLHRVGALGDLDRKALGVAIKSLAKRANRKTRA